ncbi:soma ferritin [Folsomia candida]|uniref:Ferritin n=1 Tax=Folsomia candida TaxID=158441 RepID=A0A226DKK9_FOLCA|nr:soma ferritin [Folsomia candida]OXA45729.1 Ferritin heavy chain [Folsomia candida]
MKFYALVGLCLVWWAPSTLAATPCYDTIHASCGTEEFSAYDAASCTAEWGAFPRLGNDTNRLIALHIKHSMQYLLTANYFNEWNVNRPGFHAFFSKLADEEWNSAIDIMTHMLKRGGRLDDNFKLELPKNFENRQNEVESLAWALDLEKEMALQTLHLAYNSNHVPKEMQNLPRDAEFADFLAERLNAITVLRIKHMSNYVNILGQIMGSGMDKAYAMFTFDHEILK